MPTYEYRCGRCGHQFEEFQSIKANPLKTCPECKTENLKRLLGAGAGLIFKGSGFYITDYKNNGNGKAEKDSSKPAKEAKSTADSAKETSKQSSEKTSKKDSTG